MTPLPKIITIIGPTASGKSSAAVELARAIGGEVISADSRQVYKGLDIGTGKITKKEMRGVPHHLLDVASAERIYSVSDWTQAARKKIGEIVARGHVPIICGGTGFYVDTLLGTFSIPEVPPNEKLRKKLEGNTADVLFATLQKLDPVRAATIDKHNPVRLIRAIEIATTLGNVPKLSPTPQYTVLSLGILPSDEDLKKRIHTRLIARLKAGMIREVEKLHKKGLSWKRMHELGLEYRYLALFLQKKISRTEIEKVLEKEIWQYARRQKTWFKKNKATQWYTPKEVVKMKKVAKVFLK